MCDIIIIAGGRQQESGVWLSLVERYVRDVEAAGSNPVTPILGRGAGNLDFIGFPVFFCVWEKDALRAEKRGSSNKVPTKFRVMHTRGVLKGPI